MRSTENRTGKTIEDFSQLEAYLDACLEPVSPRTSFERNLEHRIEKRKSKVEPEIAYLKYSLMAIFGLLLSMLVIVLGIRVSVRLMKLLGIRKTMQHN